MLAEFNGGGFLTESKASFLLFNNVKEGRIER